LIVQDGLKIKLDTPEDIIKWREERRKKFPTKARVQEKLEEEKERFAVGAVIPQESFGYQLRSVMFLCSCQQCPDVHGRLVTTIIMPSKQVAS